MSIGIIIGFIAGLINSVYFTILPNKYFQDKMYRLAASSLQEHLNKWVILSLLLFIVLLLSLSFVKFFWKLLFVNVVEFNVKNKNKLRYILGSGCIISFVLFICGVWAINHYFYLLPARLYPIGLSLSMFSNVGILLFMIFLGWALIGLYWENIFKHSIIKYIKITFLVFASFLIIFNLGVYIDGIVNTPKGPNVILISIDTLRADHLGSYGYDRNTSPNIDSFAKNNILFKNSFVQDSWTLPSHMSILTSLYPATHGVKQNKSLDPTITTLSEVLKNEGYLTSGIVQDCIWLYPKYGFNQGFDRYVVKNFNPKNPELNAEFQNRFISEYLQKNKKKKKFLFIHYFDVHSDFIKLPYDSPEPYMGMFYPDYSGDFDGGFGDVVATRYLKNVNLNRIKIAEDDLKYIVSLYDSGIAYMDNKIGDLFNILRAAGLYENSLIILTSDHGEEFQEHGRMLHNNLFYDETMHVPLIVKLPGQNNNHREFNSLIESIDIMPSILDFLGVEKKPYMQGESFFSLIDDNGAKEWKENVFAFGDNSSAFIRTKRWKLLTDSLLRKGGFKLFDLLEDPMEKFDVKDKYPEVTKNLKNELIAKYKAIQKKTSAKQVILTEEQKEKLKALGYLK